MTEERTGEDKVVRPTQHRLASTIAVLLALNCALAAQAPPRPPIPAVAGADALKLPFETYTLPNGLTVILSQDKTTPTVTKVTVSPDNKSARITLSKLEEGHVHQLTATGVRSGDGLPLLHNVAYYTLNYIPGAQ